MNIFIKTAAAALIATSLGSGAFAQALQPDTVTGLASQVSALRASLDDSKAFIEAQRPRVEELEYIRDNSAQITDEMIADLQEQIDFYKAGSEYHTSIQTAKTDLQARIDKWSQGSDAQKRAAEILTGTLGEFDALDVRRDDLVGRALSAKGGLELARDDIEALLVVEAYQELSVIFTDMLDSFEQNVSDAEALNSALIDVSGIPDE